MKPLTFCLSAIVLLAASASAYAEAKSDAAARAKMLAPFVEAETIAVAHLDLTRLDPQSALDLAVQVMPMSPSKLAWAKEETLQEMRRAIDAGVKEISVVVTPGNRGWLPRAYGIIPMLPDSDEKAMRAALKAPSDFGRFIHGAYVFPFPPCFSTVADKQPPEFRPAARPELAEALAAAGDSAVQAALIPPPYTHRVIEELVPQFPKEIGGGPTSVLTRGVCWAAVGIDLQPHLTARLTIKSADAQAAESLRAKLAEAMRLIGERKEVRAAAPKFDEAAAVLAPKVEGDRLVLVLNERNHGVTTFLSLIAPPIESARESATATTSMRNLMMIGLAMHGYAAANKAFPPAYNSDKNGKPLLSWRVYVLPFLGENDLFKQFHLDEPWDSPHNRTLIDKMPSIYRLPMSKTEKSRTNYLLPVGNGAAFDADRPTQFKDIKDGLSNTIMAVEVDDEHAVIWTKPEDWSFDPKDPTRGLGRFFNGAFHVVICDGSAMRLLWPTDAKDIARLRAMFTRAGGEKVER